MKFTEGYWLRQEDANAQYAMQAFKIDTLSERLRIVSPVRKIISRDGALDVGTITTEFYSVNQNAIGVKSYHFETYDNKEPTFEKVESACPVNIKITEEEAVMQAGQITVRVDLKNFGYSFEADGKTLTSCSFRNLGYMQLNRKNSTMLPKENYLLADYKPYMSTELSLGVGECVYGFGERFTAFVKNGQTVEIWNEDGGTSSQVAYKNIPFYITNHNYGVFVDHTTPVSFEVASEKVEYVGFSVPGEEIRYQIHYGKNMKDIISSYTSVTGRPALPPAWSFGLWLSTSFTTVYDEETTSSFINGMAERNLPISVFHFDCYWMKELQWCDFEWDDRVFPDVAGMLARYRAKGLKICLWINPYIAQGTKAFREGVENGYFIFRKDGNGIKQMDSWQPGMAIVDFTNPAAFAWYQEKLRNLLHMGVDCFKTDFGERIPIDVVYHNKADVVGMHNYYTQLYNKCVFELLNKELGENEAVLFARSATAGGQQFPVHWGGDSSAQYCSMAESLRGGLSFMLSGFSFWSHDIAGFEMTATPDLYKRWVQFGMLSTHSRLHGSKSYRVPWIFDDESIEVLRSFTHLKCQLMPYLYAKAINAHTSGVPVMRPMVMEFCDDPAVDYLDRQYMLGESLLVAPIFNEHGIGDYYLPKGTWTHLLSKEVREGGRWYRESYGYDSLPLFVKNSTLLPICSNNQKPDYNYTEGIKLHLFALTEGACAACDIPDIKGNIVLNAQAHRTGNQITLISSKYIDELEFVLENISSFSSVEGASVTHQNGKLAIKPIKEHTEIKIIL